METILIYEFESDNDLRLTLAHEFTPLSIDTSNTGGLKAYYPKIQKIY